MLMLAVLVWSRVVWEGKRDLQVGSEESDIFFNATKRHMLVTHTLVGGYVRIRVADDESRVKLTIHLEQRSR